MVGLRKGHCYTYMKRAYTRRSRRSKKNYIKTIPPLKLTKYDMGDNKKKFDFKVSLVVNNDIQIRQNSIESARQVVNRRISEAASNNYFMKVSAYPHHVLRENRMLGGAHADRLQTGMAHAFGMTINLAAQVKKGKPVFTISVNKEHVEAAKTSLKFATPRMPGKFSVKVEKA